MLRIHSSSILIVNLTLHIQVQINAAQGPHITGAMNLPPTFTTKVVSTNSTLLTVRVTGLFRLTKYTFQIGCSNHHYKNGALRGRWGNYSVASDQITTLPSVPTAPVWNPTVDHDAIIQGWDILEVPIPPKYCWVWLSFSSSPSLYLCPSASVSLLLFVSLCVSVSAALFLPVCFCVSAFHITNIFQPFS